MAIPSPKDGFITINQTMPVGPMYSGAQLNSTQQFDNLHAARPISAGDVGCLVRDLRNRDAFPAKPDAALALQMKITSLGSTGKRLAATLLRLA
ncbi:hypothetical protein ACTGJ9_011895 [Bradyrhizobium sp. RDM12]